MPTIDNDKQTEEQKDKATLTSSPNEKGIPTSHLVGIVAAIGLVYAGSRLFTQNPTVTVSDDDPIINAIMGPH